MTSRAPQARRVGRSRLAIATVTAAVAGTLLAACGDPETTTNTSQAFRARSAPGISLASELTVSGSAPISATWVDDISAAASASTCAEAVKGYRRDAQRYDVPRPPLTTSFSGHTVRMLAIVLYWHGPGTYNAPANVMSEEGSSAIISVDGFEYGTLGGGTATVTVNPDDSGKLVFNKLSLVPTRAPGSLSGTLTWTCTGLRTGSVTPLGTPTSGGALIPTPVPTPTPTAKPTPTPTPKR
jgi:hypothetical protein